MPPIKSKLTASVHTGSKGDPQYGGIVNPIYHSAAYDYEKEVLYPRYYNTPNQKAVVEKIAALENAEDGLIFSSGMAAIITSLFAMLKSGDHILFQHDLYGGTHHAALHELNSYGIAYSMVDVADLRAFEKAIRKETKVIYVETPSNPLLKTPDLQTIRRLADTYDFAVVIDETIGNFINVHVLPYADIVVSSLSKIFSGDSNVMGGR